MAASATEHEHPEGVDEPHCTDVFMADCVCEDPKGQCVSDEEFAVFEDFVGGIEGDVCLERHCVLVDDFVHNLIEVLPLRFPFLELVNCIELEDDPDETVRK